MLRILLRLRHQHEDTWVQSLSGARKSPCADLRLRCSCQVSAEGSDCLEVNVSMAHDCAYHDNDIDTMHACIRQAGSRQ